MRLESEVEAFEAEARARYVFGCKVCFGSDPDCPCDARAERIVKWYEACIPSDFWGVKARSVTHNRDVFDNVVDKYAHRLGKALTHGYGLILLGDNGVGKTMFLSYVLTMVIRAGRSAYYTTMPKLDYDIKRSFREPEVERRLRIMLTSDFLAIDEMGKERFKSDKSTHLDFQVERILKQRFDDSQPVLIASNMDSDELGKAYGPTIGSVFSGKYQSVAMAPGDFRRKLRKRMKRDMEY